MSICRDIALMAAIVVGPWFGSAQILQDSRAGSFTRADTLRGMLTPLRTCYDVTYYHLDVKIDTADHSLIGSTGMEFLVKDSCRMLQIDLYENMRVDSILSLDGTRLRYTREANAVFVQFPSELMPASHHRLTTFYSGTPQVSTNPPWAGGFTWTHDSLGHFWGVVTCEGAGASLWWPCKDHPSDEPDSMLISITVATGLMDISNGRLRNVVRQDEGWARYDWFVSAPINNYNVTVNIGIYDHIHDFYVRRPGDTLTLDYFVMPYQREKALKHFTGVRTMLQCFEHYFGPYPFSRDGFKLIESPHNGMEHQSAIAYGNRYLWGYGGNAPTESGLTFDYIIVHESAHEWWGNSVTAKDFAELFIHESFATYAEALYVEYTLGYDEAMRYINARKTRVANAKPIIGPYGVNKAGPGDMYPKGALILNTLRHGIGNDSLWWETLYGLASTFRHKVVTAEDILQFINRTTGRDWTAFFDQYFRHAEIPTLEVNITKKGDAVSGRYRWKTGVKDFGMPVKIRTPGTDFFMITPTTSWQDLPDHVDMIDDIRVAEDEFYVNVRVTRTYVDPRKPG
jgi:aminopeptidase N